MDWVCFQQAISFCKFKFGNVRVQEIWPIDSQNHLGWKKKGTISLFVRQRQDKLSNQHFIYLWPVTPSWTFSPIYDHSKKRWLGLLLLKFSSLLWTITENYPLPRTQSSYPSKTVFFKLFFTFLFVSSILNWATLLHIFYVHTIASY